MHWSEETRELELKILHLSDNLGWGGGGGFYVDRILYRIWDEPDVF